MQFKISKSNIQATKTYNLVKFPLFQFNLKMLNTVLKYTKFNISIAKSK